jgi:two-component system, cell cycle sensor histidine kinase and response regulator CckA
MKRSGIVQRTRRRGEAPSRVLVVDDDPIQLKLCKLRLRDEGFIVETAATPEAALAMARSSPPDLILSDVIMGALDGFGLCRQIREDPELASVPVVLLSAHYRGETDRDLAARVGASALVTRTPDFEAETEVIYQSLLSGKAPGAEISEAVIEQQLRSTNQQLADVVGEARRAELRYRAMFEHAADIMSVLTPEGLIVDVNGRCKEVMGLEPEQMIGRHIGEFAAFGADGEDVVDHRSIGTGAQRRRVRIRRPDGDLRYVEFSTVGLEIEGERLVLSIGRDMTETVAAGEALAAAKEKYRSVIERIPDVIWTANRAGQITFVTSNVAEVMGVEHRTIYEAGGLALAARVHPEDRAGAEDAVRGLLDANRLFDIEFRWAREPDRWIWLRARAISLLERDGIRHFEGMISDVTEKRRLEESLRQAQKMEAIGQLSGGIAHDFNNILATIIASSHFLLADLSASDPRREDAEQIKLAAERAAALTRQLLAFSRRQILAPTVLDLNATVAGIEKMLRRFIGEDIELAIVPGAELGSVRADPSQIEQVVMNLVVNARDAMPKGGKLSIETTNVSVGEPDVHDQGAIPAGEYVMLAVSDTGCGMDGETKRRLFEPFFTTKERGRGTGLGLSTCYGIVKQSGGTIWAYSEPGHGAVFKVCLPRVDAQPTSPRPARRYTDTDLRGSETIVVIEDDDRVRAAVVRILAPLGYKVVTAANGAEAMSVAALYEGKVDLVVSDVVVPGVSGPEAVAEVRRMSPRAKALFMSGYTDHAILRDGVLQSGVNFIQKPFAPEVLLTRIREVLDGIPGA